MNAQVNAFSHIIQQMADNASFLWVLRGRQRREPHVFAEHIQELDTRIQANLNGLLLYGDDAWAVAQANGEFPQGGEAFCLGYLAFSVEDIKKIQYATEFGLQNPDTFKGLVSALAWLPGIKVHPWVTQFFHSKNLDHKRLALAACRVRKEDPAGFLTQICERKDCIEHTMLLAEALRTAGYFKREDLVPYLSSFLQHPDPQCLFWAIYAILRLGQPAPIEALKSFCTTENNSLIELKTLAVHMSMFYLPIDIARAWIGEWVEQGQLPTAVQACGLLGDSNALAWLVEQMAIPALNRIAGEAFLLISGLNPPELTSLEHAEPEEITNLEDDNLPWVDPVACLSLVKIGTLATQNNFRTQLKNASLNAPYKAMRYQRLSKFITY